MCTRSAQRALFMFVRPAHACIGARHQGPMQFMYVRGNIRRARSGRGCLSSGPQRARDPMPFICSTEARVQYCGAAGPCVLRAAPSVCEWAAAAQGLSDCLAALHIQPRLVDGATRRAGGRLPHRALHSVGVRGRRACSSHAGRGPCAARLQGLLPLLGWRREGSMRDQDAWPGLRAAARMVRSSACAVSLSVALLRWQLAGSGSVWTVSICCPLWAQPGAFDSFWLIPCFRGAVPGLAITVTQRLSMCLLACPHARVSSVP